MPIVARDSRSASTVGPSDRSWVVGRPGVTTPAATSRGQLAHDLTEDVRGSPDQDTDVETDEVDLVLVHELPVGDRGLAARQAEDDDPAGDALGRGEARPERGASRRLQDEVDAHPARQPQHLGREVVAARVQDVVGAQGEDRGVLAGRRGRDHGRAVVPGHRDRGLAGGARRGVHQHRLPRCDPAQRLERGQRGRPVHDEAERLLLAPAGRHRHGRGRRQHHVLGERAVADTDDPGSRQRAGHPVAHRDDLARRLESRHVRRPWTVAERAAGLRDVREVDAGGAHPDQDLALARHGHRCVGDETHVPRPVEGRLLERAHGRGDAHRRSACLSRGQGERSGRCAVRVSPV